MNDAAFATDNCTLTLRVRLIDSVNFAWEGDVYIITVSFRDSLILKLSVHQGTGDILATISSPSLSLTVKIPDHTYDEFEEWLARSGYSDEMQW